MKLSLALFLTTAVSSVSAIGPMRASATFLKAARRLEEAEEDEAEDEYAFLANYNLKMLSCNSDEAYKNPETGEMEYGSVVFRLCPSDSCSNESTDGCGAGFGDYVVGINSFVEQYVEAKKDEMQQDDNFDMEEFGECREFEVDQDAEDEDGEEDEYQNQYYVGPACTDDGKDIKLDFFTNEGCNVRSEDVTFEEISNGWALPFSSGGLVSSYCESCAGYNDNGEYELNELCERLYENAGKCEEKMETFSAYGQQTNACEQISKLMPVKKGGAGKAIGWLFFVMCFLGLVAVAFTMIKKKNDDKSFGLMNE